MSDAEEVPAAPKPGPPSPPLPDKPSVGTSYAGTGVLGQSNSGVGVFGQSLGYYAPGRTDVYPSDGVRGEGAVGVHGVGDTGVLGEGTKGPGVYGKCNSAQGSGVLGENTGAGAGVGGNSAGGAGVHGEGYNGVQGNSSNPNGSGVWGENSAAGYGVGGKSAAGEAVHGESTGGTGVRGIGGFNGVQGNSSNPSGSGVWGENSAAGYGVGGKSAKGRGVYGSGSPGGHFDGGLEVLGNANIQGDATIDGKLTVKVDIVLTGSDCAEQFETANISEAIPGTVMIINEAGLLEPCRRPYDGAVAGVISGAGTFRPGLLLGMAKSEGDRFPVALVGRVYCKVDANYASVRVGDMLTTSSTQGHAMKAEDRARAFGTILGKALKPLQSGCDLIPILVTLQ